MESPVGPIGTVIHCQYTIIHAVVLPIYPIRTPTHSMQEFGE